MKIGLTGSIGVGKSSVFKFLKDILKDKASYIDADEITHEMYEKKEVLDYLYKLFNTKDRKEISEIVFNDSEKLKLLNEYMHKIIIDEIKKRIKNTDKEYVIVDIPLLYELKLNYIFDKIIVVYAPSYLQIDRICKRNNISQDEAKKRIASQIDIEDKKKMSEYVVENISSLQDLYLNTLDVIMKIVGDKNGD